MHLLDLKGTNIFTGKAMDVLTINLDSGGLDRLLRPNFVPKKRLLDYEQQLEQAIFQPQSRKGSESLLSAKEVSTNMSGGAGTGM